MWFSIVGSKPAQTIPSNDLDSHHIVIPTSDTFELKHVLYVELGKVLKNTPGLDKVSNKLLKAARNSIIDSLVYIFNLSLMIGIFPAEMDSTNLYITRIYKSGNKMVCREKKGPISMTSAVSCIFGKIIYKRLIHCLKDNSLKCI